MLDPTKLIPEEEVPVRRVGRLVLDRVVDNFFAETEQVAFCTQNIVPGIDFTNDPLLQGRNFSYLDTQLKRLGSPNFTQLPVNAPKCPFAHFQQDGHMAMANPHGRANYEPNSWDPREAGRGRTRAAASAPSPTAGAGQPSAGCGRRASPTTTARPGSSIVSQTEVEQQHIADAFVFELSKCDAGAIRTGWWPGCATSTTTWPARRRRAWAWPSCPTPLPAARRARHATWAVAGAEHPGQRPGQLRRPQARRPGHRRRATPPARAP